MGNGLLPAVTIFALFFFACIFRRVFSLPIAVDLGARFNFALQSDSDFVLLQGKMPEDLVPLLAGAAMASRRLWLFGITIDGM